LLRIATPANEAMILECARLTTASQLEKLSRKYAMVQRHCRDQRPRDDEQRRYVRRRDTDDGMVKIEAVLHPEEAELVWTMLDHAAKHLTRDPRCDPQASHDSAESGTPTTTAALALAAITTPLEADAVDLREPVPAALTATALSSAAAWSSDDSAESPEATDVHAANAAGALPDIGPAVATASDSVAGSNDDSAESPEVPDVHAAITATALPGIPTAATASDSAAWSSSDTAESPEATDVTSDAVPPADGTDAGPSTPLLDRLLDELEAGRELAIANIEEPASATGTEPRSVREPSVLHRQADATKRAFSRADALISVAQGYLRGERPNRTPIDVTLTIPVSSLRKDAVDTVDAGCMGDSCVSADTARRLCCDAGVVDVIEDEQGVPLSVGRKRRTIAGSIKRALLKRDTRCVYPGCEHRTFLEGHHIEHWADGGETTLDNAALLCSHHHRYVHEYGYVIELGPDKRPRFRDPSGRLVAVVPARHGGPELGWPSIRESNEPLAIDADTIACEWDGSRVNYGMVVDQLVVVDGLT
jgi:hypothetical protein